ncbi:MAG: nucleotidyltransferase domain-containing protein [Patescibacteria group bacterium]
MRMQRSVVRGGRWTIVGGEVKTIQYKGREATMSFLFSWSAICHDRFPKTSDLSEVFDHVLKHLRERCELFAAAVLFGSVPQGNHSVRSDVDGYIVLAKGKEQKGRNLLDRCTQYAKEKFVPLQLLVLTEEQAYEAPYRFGPSYQQMWQRLRSEGLVIGKPERFATRSKSTIKTEMERKLDIYEGRVKMWSDWVQELQTSCDGEDLWAEKFAMRCRRKSTRPFHFYWSVARVLLLWKNGELPSDNKDVIFSTLIHDKFFRPLLGIFSDLKILDDQYEHLFLHTLAGSVEKDEYHTRLAELVSETVKRNIELLEGARELVGYMSTGADLDAGSKAA